LPQPLAPLPRGSSCERSSRRLCHLEELVDSGESSYQRTWPCLKFAATGCRAERRRLLDSMWRHLVQWGAQPRRVLLPPWARLSATSTLMLPLLILSRSCCGHRWCPCGLEGRLFFQPVDEEGIMQAIQLSLPSFLLRSSRTAPCASCPVPMKCLSPTLCRLCGGRERLRSCCSHPSSRRYKKVGFLTAKRFI